MKNKILISIAIFILGFFMFNGEVLAKKGACKTALVSNGAQIKLSWDCTEDAYVDSFQLWTGKTMGDFSCTLHSTCGNKNKKSCNYNDPAKNSKKGSVTKTLNHILSQEGCKELVTKQNFHGYYYVNPIIKKGVALDMNGNDLEDYLTLFVDNSSNWSSTGEYTTATSTATTTTTDDDSASGDRITRNTKGETNIGLTTYGKNDPNANINAMCAKLRTHDGESESFMDLFEKYWNIVLIVVPILMILFTSIEYLKAVTSNDQDLIQKATNNTIKRLIASLLIFALPVIIRIIFGLFGLSACL